MVTQGNIGRRIILAMLALSMAVTGSGLRTHDADAASSYVQGSYAAAMTFADEFCADTSSDGVGPSYNGIGDLVWITAPGGGGTITADRGDLYAPVEVHIAGKFCSGYSGTNGGSNYKSDRGSISGQQLYKGDKANTTFHVAEPANLYIGDISSSGADRTTYRINMSLASFFTPSGGVPSIPKDSPNAWTDLIIDYTDRWSINGQSYVRNNSTSGPRSQGTITANLNDVVHWDHDLRNVGPDNMERDIYYNVDKSGYSGSEVGINDNKARNGFARGTLNQLFVTLYAPGSPFSVKTIGQQDVGAGYDKPPICQRIAWKDKAWNDGSWGWSESSACVRVPYNYNLIPGVSGATSVAAAGSTIPDVFSAIDNRLPGSGGQTTVSEMAHWERWRIEVPPGGSIPMAELENGAIPCTHYGNVKCEPKGNGDQIFEATNTPTQLPTLSGETVGASTLVGSRICYAVSVRPYSQASDTEWRHSAPVCVTVSKQPKVQVWGGDVRTRGDIETRTTSINDGGSSRIFGSWVEYGALSVGSNTGFASGAGLNNGTTNTATASWHNLTFANADSSAPCTGGYGCYTLDGLPTITDQFIGAATTDFTGGGIAALPSGTYKAGNVDINGASTVGQEAGVGKSIIIVSDGTVTISEDITYTGEPFTAVNQVPQVVIIANAINITNNVERVDAWLLTRGPNGVINTCSDRAVDAPLNSTVCNRSLTVNGPVATQHLHLRRTAGSDNAASAGSPAEIFNLRPDAYMWAYARASQAGKAQTVDSVELPPRF